MDYKTLYDKAERILEKATPEDYKDFKANPYTRALTYMLKGDISLILDQWANGVFSGESTDATALANAKALGQLHTVESVLEHISELEEDLDDHTDRT